MTNVTDSTTPTDAAKPSRAWYTKKRFIIPIALVALLVWIGMSGGDVAETPEPAAPVVEPAAAPEPEPAPEPDMEDPAPAPEPEPVEDPQGDIEGYCDYLLDFEEGHTFAASVDVTNTGNVGTVVQVTATFDQIGRDPVELTDKVRVPIGETKAVQLEQTASDSEIDRHQSANGECDITGDVVDTFGPVE